ncbi:ArsR/SmtB family transcription factor [uncultured Amnibacterium sp.]|uniref:ArsR/SmtB family transcription factor n=1 Tax=uncultured Amnibacterium sp. TaxID=1631851 RepID=UPI0035C97C93
MTETTPPEPRSLSLDALKALAHPLRVSLFSALTSYGPATASALAARLGESSGATSYHLRQLERHGFVREDLSRGNGRDRWWERVPGPIEIADPESATTEAGRAAGELLEAELQRAEDARFAEYRRAVPTLDVAWRQAANSSSIHLQLTPTELEELGRGIEALVARYREHAEQHDEQHFSRRRVEVQLRAFPVIDPHSRSTDHP